MNASVKLYGALSVALLLVMAASLAVGPVSLSFSQVFAGLFGADEQAIETLIVRDIRLPRTLLAVLVGGTLALGGAALQGFLRNPLAEPGLLGVTNGAALGAVVALYGGFAALDAISLPLSAMAGALLAVGGTYLLAGRTGSPLTLVLAGIAISYLFGSGVAIALNLAPNPFAAMEVVFWLMGSLANRTMDQFWLILPFVAVGWACLLACARGLDALTLGENTARSLGVSLPHLQWLLALGVALGVGAGVAVAGSIGFVGLVVPHLLRPLVGHKPGRLLPVSLFGGAILLLLADIAVRLIPTSGMELRLGVVTALLGAPFFLMLLMHARRERL